jgi:Ser/Thr protein kinase RdoA (MazF antagonist)
MPSTRLSAAVLEPAGVAEALAAYGFSTPYAIENMKRGFSSEIWRIATSQQTLVLKRHRRGTTEARVSFTTALQAFCSLQELAPRLVRTVGGAYFLASRKKTFFSLAHMIEGKTTAPQFRDARCLVSGAALLGILHCKMSEFSDPRTCPADLSIFGNTAAAKRHLRAVLLTPALPTEARTIIEFKLKNIESVAPRGQDCLNILPKQIVHGDFHLGNVVWRESGGACALDFDRAGVFFKVYEILRFLFRSILYADRNNRQDLLRVALRAYIQFASLSVSERRHALDLYIYILLCDLAGVWDRKCSVEVTEFGRYRFELLRWLLDHRPALANLLLSV